MKDSTAGMFVKIHNFGLWCMKRGNLSQAFGGLVIQFNMGAVYAHVLMSGEKYNRRVKTKRRKK